MEWDETAIVADHKSLEHRPGPPLPTTVRHASPQQAESSLLAKCHSLLIFTAAYLLLSLLYSVF